MKDKKSFSYKGLDIILNSEVYDPAEDTFLLVESVKGVAGKRVFEVGTGCGLIALDCCRQGADVVCSDVNPFAVELVNINYKNNLSFMKGGFEVRSGDLFSVIRKGEYFDVIVFNPPYLPTKPGDYVGGSGWFDVATDGGFDGLKVTFCFIDGLKNCLSKEGKAYFVFSSYSSRNKLEKYLVSKDFKINIVNSYIFDDERLDVYCISF